MYRLKNIRYHVKGNKIMISLNSPYTHNAFDDTMIKDLRESFKKAEKEKKGRVIVLTGEGKSFCAGANIKWLRKVKSYSFNDNYKDSLELANLFHQISTHPKPIIARVNGAAIGGGCGLVAACDISVASDKAFFSLSELKLGVIPAVISPYIIRRLGEGRTKELFLTGERIKTSKALGYGLINFAVSHKNLDEKVDELISYIVQSGPNAIYETKKLFKDIQDLDLKDITKHTAKVIAKLRVSKEGQEGTKAFLEKRTPNWVK